MKNLFTLFLIILLFSCADSTNSLSKQLVGRWESETLYVKRNSFKGTDSIAVLDINRDNYKSITGLKTSIVQYNPDGTYFEEYIAPDDSVKFFQSGYWFINGDTIIMAIYKPLKNQTVQRYHVNLIGNKGAFTSLMDYDGDGAEDDEFKGTSIKIE